MVRRGIAVAVPQKSAKQEQILISQNDQDAQEKADRKTLRSTR